MSDDARQFEFWIDFMRRTWCQARWHLIDLIMDAGHVREHWVQGDLFLAARTSTAPPLPWFYCNYTPHGFGGPADWSYWRSDGEEGDGLPSAAQPLMISEVKLLGGDYEGQVFAGSFSPGRFLANGDYSLAITPNHPVIAENPGYLLGDYCRLVHYKHPADPLRMMVLFLNKSSSHTPLGRCLAGVELEAPATVVVDTPMWLCKAWKITGKV